MEPSEHETDQGPDHGPDREPRPARRRPRPRSLAGIALGAAVLAAVGYGLLWSFVAAGVKDGIDTWAAGRRAEGFHVATGAVEITGFPGWIRATLAAPEIARPGPRPWSWRGPELVLLARPWRIGRFRLSAPGRHHVGYVQDGRPVEATVEARTFDAKVRLRRGRLARARLTAGDIALTDADGGIVATMAAIEVALARSAARTTTPGTDPALAPAAALSLDIDAEGLHMTREPVPGLGGETRALGVGVVLRGPPPGNAGRDALAHWRDAGGIVELRLGRLRHGVLAAAGEGTLALDDALQPIGAFTVRVRGFAEALDGLRGTGLIEPRPAALVKALLATMAKKGPGGGAAEVTLPLSVQDRRFYVGPIPLARLPAVRWP